VPRCIPIGRPEGPVGSTAQATMGTRRRSERGGNAGGPARTPPGGLTSRGAASLPPPGPARKVHGRRPDAGRVERPDVGLREIEAARDTVYEVAVRTPVHRFADSGGGEVLLKLENLQRLGAFKIRGAWNRISRLTPAERKRGVSTLSSGNHGLAVAWSARRLGIPCVVRVPEGAAPRKVEAIQALGAEVVPVPRTQVIRTHEEELWRAWPETFVHPFADPRMIAGNGTIGLEILEDLPEVDSVIVPFGGGGLISGIATAMRARKPGCRIYACEPETAAPLAAAFGEGPRGRSTGSRALSTGSGRAACSPKCGASWETSWTDQSLCPSGRSRRPSSCSPNGIDWWQKARGLRRSPRRCRGRPASDASCA